MTTVAENVQEPLPAALWDDLKSATTASLSGMLLRRGLHAAIMRGVLPLQAGMRVVGEAMTLRYVPAREDIKNTGANPEYPQRKAVETIEAGKVLVVDARREMGSGVLGDILVTRMKSRGAAGLVTDGAMRDTAAIREMGFAAFVGGVTPVQHTEKHFAIGLNEVVSCGGVQVRPGDIIVGDDDGVVVLPRAMAAEIAHDARELDVLETWIQQEVAGGAPLAGTHPPSEARRADFERWRQSR
jgi:regulator of RNase E activity RraA